MSVIPNKYLYLVDRVRGSKPGNLYLYKIVMKTNGGNDNMDDSEYKQHGIRATKIMHEVRRRMLGITHQH